MSHYEMASVLFEESKPATSESQDCDVAHWTTIVRERLGLRPTVPRTSGLPHTSGPPSRPP